MALAPTAARPPRRSSNPLGRVVADLVDEARARGGFPPGPSRGGVARAKLIAHEPLAVLLPLYEDYGPIFSVRLLHSRVVFMLGPEANHYVTVSHPQNFLWREGSFGDLIPLLGDGLLTVDGDYHRRSRKIMLPAFHRERIAGYRATMEEEARRALESRYDGEVLDVPGRPRVIFTPGHTDGHCALHLPDAGAVITADALVTLDPYTAKRGPRLVARAATKDVERNLASLDRILETGAQVVLPGHGEPFRSGVAAAVRMARTEGAA